MEKPIIYGKIVKIKPDSVYENKVFDQIVWLELQDGSILRVEDSRMRINEKMLNQTKKMTLVVFLPSIVKINEQKFLVVTNIKNINEENNLPKYQEIYGKVEWIDQDRITLYLNLGIGSVEVSVHPFEIKGIEIGDFVKTDGYRIDLDVVYPD